MTVIARVYLDANGSSPIIESAKAALLKTIHLGGNPSAFHEEGRILRAVIDDARFEVASAINALENEVIFTSGATEANRLFLDAVVERTRSTQIRPQVLMSPFEHPSLLKPALKASHRGDISLEIIDVELSGKLKLLHDQINNADIVMVCQAHNETGILPDFPTLLSLVRPDTLVMSDISQGYARLAPLPARVDVMTFSAQKIGGLAGAGGMILRGNGKKLPAPWLGGGQERGFRPGTECISLISAFGAAAKEATRQRLLHQNLSGLRDYFENAAAQFAAVKIIGKECARLPNTTALSFIDKEPDALRIACDLAGLSVGFGAACSGLAPEGSFALKRLNLSALEERATVRFSFPPTITQQDVDVALNRLRGVLEGL